MRKRAILMFASIAIILIWLYLSNPADILKNVRGTDPSFLAAAVGMMLLSLALKSYRWKLFLKDIDVSVPFSLAFTSFTAGLFISMLTPARVGEPVRGYILKKKIGSSFTQALPLIIVERVIDLVVVLIFSFIGIIAFGSLIASDTSIMIQAGTVAAIVIMAVMIAALYSEKVGRGLLGLLSKTPLAKHAEAGAEKIMSNFYESTKKIRKRTWLYAISISFTVWAMEGMILLVAIMSVGGQIGALTAIEIIAISQVIGLISSLPGGLGSIEAVMTITLVPFIGSVPLATAMVLLYRLASFWPAMLIGAVALIRTMGFGFLKENIG